jgi:Ca-activated chloride channel family protein
MLDTSVNAGNGLASFRPTDRQRTRDGVVAFLDALRAEDRVRIGSFGLQIAIGGNLTSERTELTRVLDEEIWTGGGTPLWQALVAAMQSLSSEPGRRVVLAFTNGIDTGRLPGFVGRRSNIDDFAARTNTMLYAVRLSNSVVAWDKLTDDIRQVAEASGGGHFDVPVDADLRATFVRIAEELRHQYLIGFVPSAPDGQVHQVEVRSTRPELRVRARRTFVAGGRS